MQRWPLLLALGAAASACGGPVEDEFVVQGLGSSQGEIRFGEETASHPAVGLLEMQIGGRIYLCSGTLIAADAVLTAAHCVDGASAAETFFRVGAGDTFGSGPTYGVAAIAMIPGYGAIGDVNVPDVAVLRLQGVVPDIAPLPLAQGTPTVGAKLVGVGFGQDETNGASGIKRSGLMVLEARLTGSAALP
ncbi:MAG: trypsin-like serine protease, partial [Myxococcota bacterium]